MRYSSQVKPISYLKANAAEVLLDLAERREPLVITQNGEAKAVIQDVACFEETQEALALLKLLAIGNQDIEAGRTTPACSVVARLKMKPATNWRGPNGIRLSLLRERRTISNLYLTTSLPSAPR